MWKYFCIVYFLKNEDELWEKVFEMKVYLIKNKYNLGFYGEFFLWIVIGCYFDGNFILYYKK